MMGFSLWKRIKKRLQQGRKPALRLGMLLAAATAAIGATAEAGCAAEAAVPVQRDAPSLIEMLESAEAPLSVELRRVYLCGEEVQQLGKMNAKQTIRLMQRHPEWSGHLSPGGTVILEERINDLSPACKESAVFGIDHDGRLSLFDGPPERQKVLRTFYQLDVQYMESSLPKERIDALQRGIRISDVDELNSILSTYSDYALPERRKPMKPAAISYS
jgi:forespore regulator of the sigma-K checkpoint